MAEREVVAFIVLINIILFVFIVGVVFFVIQYKKRKQLHNYELKRVREDFATELLNAQLDAQKNTMMEIGQDIHDSLGQKLSLASIYLHKVVKDINKIKVEQLNEINAILEESLVELRQISNALIKENARGFSLEKLIRSDIDRIKQLNDVSIDYYVTTDISNLSNKQGLMLRRVVQEFLQNSIRHSKATKISISFSEQDAKITLVCVDNGIGFDISKVKKGNGLNNISNRLGNIRADYHWVSSPLHATELHIKI